MDSRTLQQGIWARNIAMGITPGDPGESPTLSQNVPEILMTVEIIPYYDEHGYLHYRSQPIEPER